MITSQISLFAFYAARVILFVLIALSFFSLAFFIERLLFYRRHLSTNDDTLLKEIDSKESLIELNAYLVQHNRRETNVILKSLSGIPESTQAFVQKASAYFNPERKRWERYTVFLGTVGSNAPFIGLLGTVLGILKSFADMGLATKGGPQVVMAGISEALIVTAVGLAVAIPAVIFFNICKNRVKKSTALVESLVALISSKKIIESSVS